MQNSPSFQLLSRDILVIKIAVIKIGAWILLCKLRPCCSRWWMHLWYKALPAPRILQLERGMAGHSHPTADQQKNCFDVSRAFPSLLLLTRGRARTEGCLSPTLEEAGGEWRLIPSKSLSCLFF